MASMDMLIILIWLAWMISQQSCGGCGKNHLDSIVVFFFFFSILTVVALNIFVLVAMTENYMSEKMASTQYKTIVSLGLPVLQVSEQNYIFLKKIFIHYLMTTNTVMQTSFLISICQSLTSTEAKSVLLLNAKLH